MDLFMPANLIDLYQRLNYMDPNVKGRMDVGRWGGSADIGGSPRDQGTGLSPGQIVSACRDVVRKRGDRRHAKRFLTVTVVVLAILAAATITGMNWQSDMWFGQKLPWECVKNTFFGFYASLLYFSLMLMLFVAFRRPWQFGLIRAAGKDWWRLLPFAVLCGLTGDMVVPETTMFAANPMVAWTTALVFVPLSLELLFRGFAHGVMAQLTTIMDCESRWFFSRPTIGSSLLYAVTIGWQVIILYGSKPEPFPVFTLVRTVTVAVIFGLGAGMIRERSHSLLPAWLFHLIAVVTLLLAYGS
jgi:membrane protease YdiL (CAAX protease family)